jgi:hypothetical protein
LEPAVAEQSTLPDSGPAVRQVVLGLCEVAGAVVISIADERPDLIENPEWAKSAVSTLFETITEEGLAAGVTKDVVARKAAYYHELVSNPEIAAAAKKYGLAPDSFARTMADDFVEQMTEAVRSVVPLVLRVGQEPWSVAALEKGLAEATASARTKGSAAMTADEPAPAVPGGPAAEWYADPLGRHQLRYWDGASWTSHVADDGVQSVDPLAPNG